ncbi:uncharacterized protein LOC115711034 [Cannabis sativa]|uniref:uncharacterized protein LOC115711034 n=1 Tax=Cannabis sativa TaxID=3483 RepID=UPI0029CA5D87|nr:uncharacterized protein LOC115711034 [Cannabis sativa]
MEFIRVRLGFDSCFAVEARGHSGGLALLWKESSDVAIQGFSFNHIDAIVQLQHCVQWRLTGVYGEPRRELRFNTWNLFRSIKNASNLPWCLMGDMNNLSSNDEKRGGRPYPDRLIDGFVEALDDCNLTELPLVGYPFTWEKGRNGDNWVEERLDKALVTYTWLSLFPQSTLYNLEVSTSDHCPILLVFKGVSPSVSFNAFRFENAWIREPLCKQLVQGCWEGSGSSNIQEKLHRCGEVLGRWGRDITGDFRKRIDKCKKQIRNTKWGRDQSSIHQHNEAKVNLSEVLAQREAFWKQRSKQFWLNSGDRNTKYFHSVASARKRNSGIGQLKDESGTWVTWGSGLEAVITRYFSDLFRSTNIDLGNILNGVRPTVSSEQNAQLLLPITEDEVRNALFQMHPDKSPGPDGMTPAFFQKHWSIVGSDVVNFVRDFFNEGSFPSGINDTHIVLIPKKKNPSQVGDMRPISLCNVLYKIASKVVANRMKGILDYAISDTQSAFVSGRLISDNVMVAFEVMHYLKRKTNGRKGYMALKLDMSKAYDRVEWGFLEAILRVMGFCERWIGLILGCVNSVRYHVINNGQKMGPIIPTRGIRQGCPLSPYLFIVCAEGLSSLIKHFEAQKHITGCKVARSAPPISHLLFADDSYVYCQASEEEANHVLTLLQLFERASGQKVNLNKSSAFFSSNTRADIRSRICGMMQVQEAGADSMYLGLPSTVGRNKNAVLGFLKEKMKKRISSWEGKFLSRAGKEVLIKSVVQSLPSYAMNVFLFPIGTCNELERMMASFWWKSKRANNNGSGIVWMNWEKMTRSKAAGGMGFRNLRDFNLAMLGKQGWRLLFRHDSLVSKVFKARYYPQGDYLSAELGSNPSFIWSSIFAAKDTVKLGLRKGIGSGLTVQITTDPWLPSLDRSTPIPNVPGLENFTVNSLFQSHSRSWDTDVVNDLFTPDDAALILGIQINQVVEDDFWYWFAERNGLYSVRSAYQLIQDHKQSPILTENHRFWNKLWTLKVPPKTKDLVWRAASNCLATKANLCIKKVLTENKCPLCGVFAETELHLLVSCQFAWACWEFSGFNAADRNPVSLLSWLSFNAARMDDEKLSRVVMLCWAIWSARNDLLWKNRARSVKSVVDFAQSSLHQFLKAQGRGNLPPLSPPKPGDASETWTKPTVGIKLNVDAALFEQDLKHGFGCVIRNTEGELISVLAGAKQGKVAPEIAEALGIREALSWLKNHNYSHATVESDSLVCVAAIRSNEKLNSGFGFIVEECKLILRSLLNVTLCFVKRSANRAAHFIARHSLSLAERMFPINSVPLELLSILLGDSSY